MSTVSQPSAVDMSVLQPWIGRSETITDVIHPVPLAGLSATLDTLPYRPWPGQPVPPLWHWTYFLPQSPAHALGRDGHPRRGAFLPPVTLPRRMWAGSRFQFHQPLRVSDVVQRTSTIESIAHKQGRSGDLVFVTVRHTYRVCGRAGFATDAMTEWHDIVYREDTRPARTAPAATEQQMAPRMPGAQHGPVETQADGSLCQHWQTDPVLLFRYSALTFNGHRIHYDHEYATQVEGYPGLIVHGPLLATLLVDLVRTQWSQRELAAYAFKALSPVYNIHPFTLHARQTDACTVELWVQDWQGHHAMEATATLQPA